MKKQWQIRSANVDDAQDLKQIMVAAYVGYEQRVSGMRLPPMDLDYHAEITDYSTWVAESDGHIVGGLTMIFETEYASIANIAVHPEFQGQGLGKGLMTFADHQAKQKNLTQIRLATHVLLKENQSLYLHLGWSEYDRDNVRVYFKKYID